MNSDDSLVGLTIARFHERLADGSLSCAALVGWYLDRIASLDDRVNAVLEINEHARKAADALDKQWAAGNRQGSLHGVPILVKDNIEVGDGMCNTAGSLALEGYRPAQDAHLIARLRAAGAVILGKTNLSEWANFRSRYSSSGWSSRGGQTRNPYAVNRTPAGSSAGSGVAVAADFCLAAIGTETDGSIVSPASINGVVGIKPTVGTVSRSGIIPISHSQDTAGPMARTVADATRILSALVGPDPDDAITMTMGESAQPHLVDALHDATLRGARLGVVRDLFGVNPKSDAVMEQTLSLLSSHGAMIIDPVDLDVDAMRVHENEVLSYEFKADLNTFLSSRNPAPPIASLEELIEFNTSYAEKVMPVFGQDRLTNAQSKGDLDSPDYIRALDESRRLARTDGIDRAIVTHSLDALIAPTNGPARVIDLVNGDGGAWGKTSAPAAIAGYPHITLTAGYVRGLPIGLSFFGAKHSESRVIGLAHAFEQISEPRQAPSFEPQP